MAVDNRPFKSKEQDGQGNEVIIRDQQLVEQGTATTMASGACFETRDVDDRPVKIPRDNMMNIVLECIGIILNDSSRNLGTNVQKALGLQGNTVGHSTVADFASVLGVVGELTSIGGHSAYKLFTANEQWIRHLAFIVFAADSKAGALVLSATYTGDDTYTCKCVCLGEAASSVLKIYRDGNDFYIYNTSNVGTSYKLFMAREYKSANMSFDISGKTEIPQT